MRALLHRAWKPPRPPGRLHREPDWGLVTQQACQFAWTLQEQPGSFRFLIRDRDSKFTRDFDAVFASEGIQIIKTPVRAPKANAIASRFVCTARAECLDWLLIVNRRHLERVLRVFVDHFNVHRPHRALNLKPPDPAPRKLRAMQSSTALVERRDRLGGLFTNTASPPEPTLRTFRAARVAGARTTRFIGIIESAAICPSRRVQVPLLGGLIHEYRPAA